MSIAESPIEQALIDYLAGTPVAMTLSRAGASDFALIAANPAFTALTRYEHDEIVGRNCRFLQGEYREQNVKRQIHAFLSEDGEDNFRGLIVNVRADGQPFINLLYLAKLRDQEGLCRYVLGSQFDASRTHLSDLSAYDRDVAEAFENLRPSLSEDSILARGSYETLAAAAAAIARAKMLLAEL